MNKTCVLCSENKPFELFSKKKGGKFGLDTRCKACRSAIGKTQYKENNEKEIERSRAYRKNNKEVLKLRAAERRKKNKPQLLAYTIKRRLSKMHRTPKWLSKEQINEIASFYVMAKELEKVFPWKQCVDHIVPLQGKTVSGLHVPWNLQLLSASENEAKGNRFYG
jgi:5-methylcytosine-specific restriction endonuclease McrA